MLEFKKSELKVKLGDVTETIKFPSVRDVRDMNSMIEKKEKNELDILVDFLCKLGMNRETANELEMDHVNTIIKELTISKK